MKKLLSIICILALALSMTGTVWAGEDFSLPDAPEEDYGIAPSSVNDPSTWIPYEVTGGNIYFDPETQNIVGCDDTVTEAVIPAEIDGKAVRMIVSMKPTSGTSRLQKVVISEGIFEIGEGAFRFCEMLSEIQIPDSVIEIGEAAFHCCESLTTVDLPPEITIIRDDLFSYCYRLVNVTIPNGVVTISRDSFYNCSSLEIIELPDTITGIGEWAFRNCSSLKKIDIPDTVKAILPNVFDGCSSLSAINVGENNKRYYSEDGVLFLGQRPNGSLMIYPMAKPDEEYTVVGGFYRSGGSAVSEGGIIGNPYLRILKITKENWGIKNLPNLEEVHLPITTSIGYGTFSQCYAITDVYYDGCAERWEKVKNSAGGNNGSLFAANVHFNENDHIIQGVELELGETQTVAKFEPVSLAALGASVSYSPQVELYYLGNLLYYDMIDTYHSVSAYFEGNDVKVFVNWPEATEFSVTLIFPDSGSSENLSFNTPEFTLEDIVPTSGYVSVSITANAGNVCGFNVYPDMISFNYLSFGTGSVTNNGFAPMQTVIPIGSDNLPFGGETSDYEVEIGVLYTVAGSQTQDYYLIGRERLSQSTPHEHIFGDEWKNDAQNHWHVCKKCSQTSAPEPHTLVNGVCTACGYVQPEHVHHFACVGAEGVHWDQCDECGYTTNVRAHSIVDGRCSECGYSPAKTYDANGDGEVTLDDAIAVLKIAMNVVS